MEAEKVLVCNHWKGMCHGLVFQESREIELAGNLLLSHNHPEQLIKKGTEQTLPSATIICPSWAKLEAAKASGNPRAALVGVSGDH